MKSKLTIALLGCLIFLLGGITGIVSHGLYHDHIKIAEKNDARPAAQKFIDIMTVELDLDAPQKESLEVILEESRLRYRELNKQFRPQYETIRNETDDEIRNMLRDDQKERFEEFLKKYQPRQSLKK
ncbi:MAG TPA: hypothetical protein VLL97_00125 [Acidobacteriota bacterium]|nr:hypothetical protein [Acidobacteriota bacterium]